MACMNKVLQERRKSRAQAADEELKSRDRAKTISEMEASVSSEQQLRLAARAVNVTKEDGGLRWELALREARQHRAWKERWPCHVDGAVYIVSLYIASYVAFFRTGTNAYSSSGRYQVPGFFPGYVHTRSSPSPEPESRARVPSPSPLRSSVGPEPEPSSLDSEMDNTLSLAELPREPEHPSVSLGCRAFTGTCSRVIPYTRFPSGKWLGEWRKNETKSIQRETNTTTPEIEE